MNVSLSDVPPGLEMTGGDSKPRKLPAKIENADGLKPPAGFSVLPMVAIVTW